MARLQEDMAGFSEETDPNITGLASNITGFEDTVDEGSHIDLNELYAEDDAVEEKLSKPKNKVTRVPWTQRDVAELRLYFGDCFKTKTCPSKHQVEAAMKKSAKAGGLLYKRYWHNIVKKISNMNKKN